MTKGIHHITAITSDVQKNYEFYTQVLGLRFVKQTVNFDAPDTYHTYFGNEAGEPGTALTFFPFENAGTGMRGTGQVTTIQFAVPLGSLEFWINRFREKGVKNEGISKRFGKSTIKFFDFDNLQLELVMSDEHKDLKPWTTEEFPEAVAIRGFYGAELSVSVYQDTEKVIEELGYELVSQEINHYRYINNNSNYAKYLDLFSMPNWPEEKQGAGTVHHIAFRVEDEETELNVREKIKSINLQPTNVINRNYFKSVYFREPNKVLFEIATDSPGFTIDEPLETLGEELKIPEQYQDQEKEIKAVLPTLQLLKNNDLDLFIHKFIEVKDTKKVLLLLHGTGADERDLIPLAYDVFPNYTVLSIRGNVKQFGGMNRFFLRNEDGSLNEESIKSESTKLSLFLQKASGEYGFDLESLSALGFSNGANMILANQLLNPWLIKKSFLLHPMRPFKEIPEADLSATEIILTSGENDEFVKEGEIIGLIKELESRGAKVESLIHKGTHAMRPEEIEFIGSFA